MKRSLQHTTEELSDTARAKKRLLLLINIALLGIINRIAKAIKSGITTHSFLIDS
jgi:hypothetical protein